ncbi:hypothetical protein F5Y13DRAFT_202433 [Hypoxylon sp. FL1857]|nr:hypothetical protein F5Y13DRAFT_202433 [Hypoxylon sp. FL1857]
MASQCVDMIVGIDVGMSGTGVAYSNLAKHSYRPAPVMEFKTWENRDEEGKVPTKLVYDTGNIGQGPIAWGFIKNDEPKPPSNHLSAKSFKTKFCPSSSSTMQQQLSDEDLLPPVDVLYEHFLSKLYDHIEKELSTKELTPLGTTWNKASIEFIFSFPATWDMVAVEKFKGLARKAGFGGHPGHGLVASLTEPEAVAIYSVNEDKIDLRDDKNILVVDAGGGTIDICFANVKKSGRGDTRLAELKPNIGEDAGSTYIDKQFEELASEELDKVGSERLGNDPKGLAKTMKDGEDFQNSKHGYTGSYADNEHFLVGIPGLKSNASFEKADIVNGELRTKWGQLKQMFDEQIADIGDKIDEMLIDGKRVVGLPVLRRPDLVILSGGLSSSPYVQQELRARFNKYSFHVSSQPQLCVCKGLVYERIHSLYNGSSTFTQLCSQESFGILRYEEYDPWKSYHRLAKKQNRLQKDPMGGGSVVHCVDWLIKKGDEKKPGDKTQGVFHHKFKKDVQTSALVGKIDVVSSSEEIPHKIYTPDHVSLNGDVISADPIIIPAEPVSIESDIPYGMVV